jgi:hypothetical protein
MTLIANWTLLAKVRHNADRSMHPPSPQPY